MKLHRYFYRDIGPLHMGFEFDLSMIPVPYIGIGDPSFRFFSLSFGVRGIDSIISIELARRSRR